MTPRDEQYEQSSHHDPDEAHREELEHANTARRAALHRISELERALQESYTLGNNAVEHADKLNESLVRTQKQLRIAHAELKVIHSQQGSEKLKTGRRLRNLKLEVAELRIQLVEAVKTRDDAVERARVAEQRADADARSMLQRTTRVANAAKKAAQKAHERVGYKSGPRRTDADAEAESPRSASDSYERHRSAQPPRDLEVEHYQREWNAWYEDVSEPDHPRSRQREQLRIAQARADEERTRQPLIFFVKKNAKNPRNASPRRLASPHRTPHRRHSVAGVQATDLAAMAKAEADKRIDRQANDAKEQGEEQSEEGEEEDGEEDEGEDM